MHSNSHDKTYRGRFAPSPTGPLHLGSLVAALGSFLEARSQSGEWLVRIDDIDPPREVPGASDEILRALESLELYWDQDVTYQSTRNDAYQSALETLKQNNLTYPCGCSRAEIANHTKSEDNNRIYPGTCRYGLPQGKTGRSIRVRTDIKKPVTFNDRIHGTLHQHLENEVGDFVVRRADGLIAYHIAVVIDDAEQSITEIVRGADLLDSTPRQIYLQQLLNLPTPGYAHLPLALNETGIKLSKQSGAKPVDVKQPAIEMFSALRILGMTPPVDIVNHPAADILSWAIENWHLETVPRSGCQNLPPGINDT
ncbi:MAG: tRNA glutamyl-Q(34) synthetase GluQRS [Gammaproteobacteria bacterium]|nr:MAG: tRNA glutamyl-Q(34) synthetase GluQRS [Gammaproteobacteria bacterium]